MNTRLKQFLAAENISQAQFADSINVVRASVSHVLAGRNNPSYDFIKAIMDNYPQLNIEWLILGKGKMYKDKLSAPAQEQAPKEDSEPGLLFTAFADEADELPPAETDIPLLLDEVLPNIAASNEINTSSVQVQTPVRQRQVSKIIVLFDDGTYQEM
jgi:transcriptional regulator with XRE-family HTH domain